jgi:uncharacterized protein YcnI
MEQARRLSGLVALGAVVLVAAHVSVEPTSAAKGATADLVFGSPNERSAAIVAFEVEMPEGVTTYVPATVPGWSAAITGLTVRWSGGPIGPGATASFGLRLGPLPATDAVSFRAAQTYDDGVTVRWDEASTSRAHPAPQVLLTGVAVTTTTLAGAAGANVGHDHDTVETAGSSRPVATSATDHTNSVTGAIGIVLAVCGVVFTIVWAVFVGARARERDRRLLERQRDEPG